VLAALPVSLGGALDDALADVEVRTSYRLPALGREYRETVIALLDRLPTAHEEGFEAAFMRLVEQLADRDS
jgi:hypothetical protein